MPVEEVEHARRHVGVRSIVEGQRDFAAVGSRAWKANERATERLAARAEACGHQSRVVAREQR